MTSSWVGNASTPASTSTTTSPSHHSAGTVMFLGWFLLLQSSFLPFSSSIFAAAAAAAAPIQITDHNVEEHLLGARATFIMVGSFSTVGDDVSVFHEDHISLKYISSSLSFPPSLLSYLVLWISVRDLILLFSWLPPNDQECFSSGWG